MVSLTCTTALVCALALVVRTANAQYGPGDGPWEVDAPEKHGIRSADIELAAARVKKIKERYCFVVIKGGKVIHETYYANASTTKYETDSAAKTMIAELVGAVFTAHTAYDLDTPIHAYGVDTSVAGQWAMNLTTRHILTQSTGIGLVPPGSQMTYDSDQFIQLLSPLLGKIVAKDNMTVIEWAERNFAKPLGLGGVFMDNDLYIGGGNISAGGGQHMSCRQIARAGQLLLNRGMWPVRNETTDKGQGAAPDTATKGVVTKGATPGGPKQPVLQQLVSKEYMDGMISPSWSWGTTYGFLTWLNRAGAYPGFCCAPRWCRDYDSENTWPGYGGTSLRGIVGDDISYDFGPDVNRVHTSGGGRSYATGPVVHAPPNVLMAYGWLARVMMVLPDRDMVVVSMGQTGGKSLLGGGCAYDEGFAMSVMFKAFDDLLRPNKTLADAANAASTVTTAANAEVHTIIKNNLDIKRAQQTVTTERTGHEAAEPASGKKVAGSCFCYCPPGEGYGTCFDVANATTDRHAVDAIRGDGREPLQGGVGGLGESDDPSDPECAAFTHRAPNFCPSTGIVRQCGKRSANCTDSLRDWAAQDVACEVSTPCPPGHPQPFDHLTCTCRPVAYYYCGYTAGVSCSTAKETNPHVRKPVGQRTVNGVPRF